MDTVQLKSFYAYVLCFVGFFFFHYKKAALQTIGEDQGQNPYTELLVLEAHRDIVRFLVRLDDFR
jgi:hypothetical protein